MTNKRILLSAIWNQDSGMDVLFDDKYFGSKGYEELEKEKNVVLVLWGGEDISPALYNQKPSLYTFAKPVPSTRDLIEKRMAEWAIKNGFPIIGVCRGAQMMCALSGGKLVQDVNGHFGHHPIYCKEVVPGLGDVVVEASSIHHQMMIPDGVDHQLIAFPEGKRSNHYRGQDGEDIAECLNPEWREPEIVWFPKTKALCIQGHPEYMGDKTPFVQLVTKLVEHFCLNPQPHTNETEPNRG